MDWITIVKIVGMIATLIFMGFLLKEFRKSIQESKAGKTSGRCDLD
jgi:uncharacterized membrane protein